MIKAFGPLRDWEYTFDPFWTEIPYHQREAEETVNEAIRAVLFGFSPQQKEARQRFMPPAGTEEYRAAMLIATDDGEFLLGRNFTHEALEVFKLETKRLFALSAMALMDLLLQELQILNPLDFAVIGFFPNESFAIDQNAPLIRDHIRKISSYKGFQEILRQSGDEAENRRWKEELAALDDLLAKLDRFEAEALRLAAEEKNYAVFEKFLTPSGEDLLTLTTREYTAATLETSFYEEQVRKEAETRAILEQEKAALRQKIAAFDPLLYTPETERRVTRLLDQRTDLNKLLQALEEALEQHERKGIWPRLGGKEREEELNRRISTILQKLAQIREEFRALLQNKKPEDFLKEMALLEQYRKDLAFLERPPLLKDQGHVPWEELERARQKEEALRQKRDQLLALAGSADLATVQQKVQALRAIKHRRKQVEDKLAAILEALEEATLEDARRYLRAMKQERESKLEKEDPGVEIADPELAALCSLYRDGGRFLAALTEGEGRGLLPRLEGNLLRFSVLTADDQWRPAEKMAFSRPDLPDLAFRLALAKKVWGETQPLLLLDDFASWLPPKAEQALHSLLKEEFSAGQIIIRVR